MHLACLLGAYGLDKFERQKGREKGSNSRPCKGENLAAPFQANSSDSHAIASPFQVCIMSMKCPRSNPK